MPCLHVTWLSAECSGVEQRRFGMARQGPQRPVPCRRSQNHVSSPRHCRRRSCTRNGAVCVPTRDKNGKDCDRSPNKAARTAELLPPLVITRTPPHFARAGRTRCASLNKRGRPCGGIPVVNGLCHHHGLIMAEVAKHQRFTVHGSTWERPNTSTSTVTSGHSDERARDGSNALRARS